MTVKDRTGRKRYILFGVTSLDQPEKRPGVPGDTFYFGRKHINRELASHLREMKKESSIDPGVLFMDGNLGIFRCCHLHQERSIDMLNGLKTAVGRKVRIATIVTSGTIRSVKKKMESILAGNGNSRE